MDNTEKLRRKVIGMLQDRLDAREPTLVRSPGVLGQNNDQGTATVPGKPGYCYIRMGNDETRAIVFNNRTPHTNGLPVIAGFDPAQKSLFQVLSARHVYDNTQTLPPGLGPHHASHEWGNSDGGDDIVYSRLRQILDCLVFKTAPETMTVNIADGLYVIDQAVFYYGGGTLDLTSYIPGSGYVWVTLAMNPSGLYAVGGVAGNIVLYSDIPAALYPEDWRIAAVRLHDSSTTITDWPDEKMIVDLRYAGNRKSDTGYKIVLYSGGWTEYAADDTGMALAIAAAVSGDTIWVPPGTYANGYAVPGGVTVKGAATRDVIFQGQMTLRNTSELETLSVVRSYDDSLDYTGVLGPDSGTAYLRNCYVRVLQAGAGSGWGVSCYGRDGDLHVYQGRIEGTTADVRQN